MKKYIHVIKINFNNQEFLEKLKDDAFGHYYALEQFQDSIHLAGEDMTVPYMDGQLSGESLYLYFPTDRLKTVEEQLISQNQNEGGYV